jgi:hypothetical protein
VLKTSPVTPIVITGRRFRIVCISNVGNSKDPAGNGNRGKEEINDPMCNNTTAMESWMNYGGQNQKSRRGKYLEFLTRNVNGRPGVELRTALFTKTI